MGIRSAARWLLRRLCDEDNHVAYLEEQVEKYARAMAKQSETLDWYALRASHEYEMGTIGTPKERFLNGLADLTRQTGIEIAGCGCCLSPFLMEANLEDQRSGYVCTEGDEAGAKVEWCDSNELRRIQKERNEPVTVYRGKQYGPSEAG